MAKKKITVVTSIAPPRINHFVFFVGLLLAAMGVFLLLSLLTANLTLDPETAGQFCLTGLCGAWVAYYSVLTVGWIGAYMTAALFFLWGAQIMRRNFFWATWVSVLGGGLIISATSLLSGCLFGKEAFLWSGLLCRVVMPYAALYFGGAGVILAAALLGFIGLLIAFGGYVIDLGAQFFRGSGRAMSASAQMAWRLGQLAKPRVVTAFAGANVFAGACGGRETVATAEKVADDETEAAKANNDKTPPSASPEKKKATTILVAPAETPASEAFDFRKVETPAALATRLNSATLASDEIVAAEADDNSDILAMLNEVPSNDLNNATFADEESHNEFSGEENRPLIVAPANNLAAEGQFAETNATEECALANAENAAIENAIAETDAENIDEAAIANVFANNVDADDDTDVDADENVFANDEDDNDVDEVAMVDAQIVSDEIPPKVAENPYEKLATAKVTAAPIMKSTPVAKSKTPYQLPSLLTLDTPPPPLTTDVNQLEKRASQLIKTLNHFKIQGQVVGVQRGPRITQFEISIAAGIPVSKIRNLADNIAMDLKAMSVRIIAPIPGRDTIGIEIPNVEQELVALRDIVATVNREKRKQLLPLCLAKDVSGAAIVADLAKMPHLMIAGSTGSGKSVCINSIIMSFLMCMTPDECKLIMVDPKVVELSRFHDIPHLMSPVITDMQKAVGVLEWACQEMDERYEKLSMVSVNNLAKFNALSVAEIRERVVKRYGEAGLDDFPTSLPFIVIIIDELADLMMVAKKEVEHHIARLAAKSRAVGIHLILATQRPSTDVITGLIKANMPSRIAFQVSSKIDSRIILDQSGAEALLGQGDMLYLPPGASKIQRAQGVFVSDEELFKVVDFCKSQRAPEYHASLEGPVIGAGGGNFDLSKVDELFFQAGEAIITEQRGSVSLLQRKFGVGYGRAARIIDQLAEAGILGAFKGAGKPREIMLEIDEFYARFGDEKNGGAYNANNKIAGLRDDEQEWA